jgi:hypothetical protein
MSSCLKDAGFGGGWVFFCQMKIRQDGMDLHRLMAEVRAIIEKQVEQQKTFEKMVIANGILESTQVSKQQHLC